MAVLLVVAHGPVALGAADLIEEVADHVGAVLRVVDLRVVLDAVEAPGSRQQMATLGQASEWATRAKPSGTFSM